MANIGTSQDIQSEKSESDGKYIVQNRKAFSRKQTKHLSLNEKRDSQFRKSKDLNTNLNE